MNASSSHSEVNLKNRKLAALEKAEGREP